jgi:hypothetical protein
MNDLSPEEVSALRVKLKDHFEIRLSLLESLINVKLSSLELKFDTSNKVSEDKVHTANDEMQRHLGTMNEWRMTVTDILATMVPKTENNVWKDKIESALLQFRDFKITMDTKASAKSLTITYIVTGITLLISTISLLLAILATLTK